MEEDPETVSLGANKLMLCTTSSLMNQDFLSLVQQKQNTAVNKTLG